MRCLAILHRGLDKFPAGCGLPWYGSHPDLTGDKRSAGMSVLLPGTALGGLWSWALARSKTVTAPAPLLPPLPLSSALRAWWQQGKHLPLSFSHCRQHGRLGVGNRSGLLPIQGLRMPQGECPTGGGPQPGMHRLKSAWWTHRGVEGQTPRVLPSSFEGQPADCCRDIRPNGLPTTRCWSAYMKSPQSSRLGRKWLVL